MKQFILVFLFAATIPATLWARGKVELPTQSAQSLESAMDALSAQDSTGQFSLFFYEYECTARNERHERFTGRSHFPRKAEEFALYNCYHYSHKCIMEGCHPL